MLQALLAGDYQGAEQRAARLQDIFGQGNLFVELQDHGIADQHRTNPQLVEIARRIGAPLLATNDSHYTHREDAVAHDALLCVQTGALLSDTNRFKFEGTEHYLKSAAEMRHLFREVPEACDNTLLIAERADVQIELGKPSLPEFPVPDRFTGATYEERAQAYLKHLAFEGAKGALRRPDAARGGRATRVRVERHRRHGLPGLLPRRLGPHPLRPGVGHPGRPGPRLGCRVLRGLLPAHRRSRPDPLRPPVRALPQSGPQADARHRHGLRRALPRRRDALRGREVRERPGRPDHHLLDHQGASGCA